MYNKTTLLAAGYDLVGWSVSNSSDYDHIPTYLLSPQTEYYVNELPGVEVDLLDYAAHEKNLSDYVGKIHKTELIKVIDTFLLRQKEKVNSKELLQNATLLQSYNDRQYPISRSSRFVGYAITPRESKSIASKIQQVGFISGAAQTFTLYLFASNSYAGIQTKSIAITSVKTLQWFDLDWTIDYDMLTGGAGETYLIGYFEADLTADLYEIDWTGANAHTANRYFGHYMGIAPGRFSSNVLNGTNLPDLKYLKSSLNCKTPGFNLRFNCKCDITNTLVDNIDMFAEAVQLKIAVRILSDCLSGIELNNVSNASSLRTQWKELLTHYNGLLNGGITEAGIPVKGLLDRLTIDFSNLDPVCFRSVSGEVEGVRW
jgi:hypothetical protein